MDTSSVPLIQCSSKDTCINPLGSWLPATEEYFYTDRGILRKKCKVCEKERGRHYRQTDAAKEREKQRALKPERIAWVKQYRQSPEYKTRQNSDRYKAYRKKYRQTPRGKTVTNNVAKRYREKHPDYVRFHCRKRRARLLKAEGSHTKADIQLLLKSQKGKCWWCSKSVGDRYHVDHRIPLTRGGSDAPENLCITCPECNIRKQNKLPQEWNGRLL